MASKNQFLLRPQQNLFCGNHSTHLNPTFQLPRFPKNMQKFPYPPKSEIFGSLGLPSNQQRFISLNQPPPCNPAFSGMPSSGLSPQTPPPIYASFQDNIGSNSNFKPRFPNCGVVERNFLPCNPQNALTTGKKVPFILNNKPVDIYATKNDHIYKANGMENKKFKEDRKHKPWMNEKLLAEVQKKNNLYFRAKKSGNSQLWKEFKLQQSRVNSLIKQAKLKAGIKLESRKINFKEMPFYCDCCDRAFKTENELSKHVALHVKCGIDNCKFEAQFKVLEIHKKMQHETGYADRILRLENDEEIKRWIEERKKRFPTTENIMKRKAEEAEKKARGEIILTKEFGKFKKRKFGSNAIKAENNQCTRTSTFTKKRNRSYKKIALKKRQINNNLSLTPNHCKTSGFEMDSDSDNDSHIKLNKFLGIVLLTNLFQHSFSKPSQKDNNIIPVNDKQIILISHDSDLNKKKLDSEEIKNNKELNSDFNDNLIANQKEDLRVKGNSANSLHQSVNSVINYDSQDDDEPPSIMPILRSSGLAKEPLKELKLKNESFEDDIPRKRSNLKSSINEHFLPDDLFKGAIKELKVETNDSQDDDEPPSIMPILRSSGLAKEPLKELKLKNDKSHDDIPSQISNLKSSLNEHVLPDDLSKEAIKELKVETNDKSNNGIKAEVKFKENCIKTSKLPNWQHSNPFPAIRKSTLLEKLLADNIRHERNVILQCIRHIVKNNFFGISTKTS